MAIMAGSLSNPPIVSRVNLTHLTRAQFDPFTQRCGEKIRFISLKLRKRRTDHKGLDMFFPPAALCSRSFPIRSGAAPVGN